MKRFLILTPCLLFAGCLLGGDPAHRNYLSESFRDLGEDPLDDEAAFERGARSAERAKEAAEKDALTLAECFRLALANSEALKIQGERMQQADAMRNEALASLLPSAAVHGKFTRDSDEIVFGGQSFTPQDRWEYWFSLSQTLLDGKTLPALSLAKETRLIESLRLRDVRERLLYDTAAAFYLVLSLEKDLEAIRATRQRFEEHLRVLDVRRRAGEAQEQEVLLAKAGFDEAEARLIQTQHDVERARNRLSRLTDVRPFGQKLVDTFEVDAPPGEVPHLVDQALLQRFDLEAAKVGIDQARSLRDLTLTDYLPKAKATFDYWSKMRGGFSKYLDWTLAVTVDWTMFDGGAREARLAQALSQIRERELHEKRLEKDIRAEVEDAVLAFRSLDRSMRAFESRAKAAKESEELVVRQFKAGEATNLDVLVGEEVLDDAQRNLDRTRYARKLAVLRIRLAAGDLSLLLREEK